MKDPLDELLDFFWQGGNQEDYSEIVQPLEKLLAELMTEGSEIHSSLESQWDAYTEDNIHEFEKAKNKTLETFWEDTLEDIQKEIEQLIQNSVNVETNKMAKVNIPVMVQEMKKLEEQAEERNREEIEIGNQFKAESI